MIRRSVCYVSALTALGLCAGALADDPAQATVVKVGRIHPVIDEPIDKGVIVVRDGNIAAIGANVEITDELHVIDLPRGVATPGLIDACCSVDFEGRAHATRYAFGGDEYSFWQALAEIKHDHEHEIEIAADVPAIPDPFCPLPHGPAGAEEALAPNRPMHISMADQSSEVTPHRRVIDSVNLFSNDFARLLRGGVTTVYVSPDSANVIGSRGAIVKTAGPLGERIVTREAAVKATVGSDPSRRGRSNRLPPYYGPAPSFHTRRPTTRMGVSWVFRKAFHDALRDQAGLRLYGADVPPEQAIPVLQQILAGAIPLRIQARMQHDIFSALRLANEFDLRFTLEEATEAYRCLPQLKAAGVPVIFGPLFMTPSGWRASYAVRQEADRPRLNAPRQLADAGIEFALTAQELRDEEGLVRQGMIAVRNGLTPDAALRAVTATPARMIGLDDRLGRLTPGAQADLVVWSTEPFSAASRPLLVMIQGRIVYRAD